MTGKDLFAALNHVDDTLVAEAETYAARRVIPMPTVRWLGALAACFCLLVGWAVLAQTGLLGMGKSASLETAAPQDAKAEWTEGAAEEEMDGGFTTGAIEEAAVEKAETTEAETGGTADSAGGAQPSETPAEKMDQIIISAFTGEDLPEEDTSIPENGSWTCSAALEQMVQDRRRAERLAEAGVQFAAGNIKDIRFLAAFRLYVDGKEVDPDSDAYEAEVQRLIEQGYEFRLLQRTTKTGSFDTLWCGLFTASQLDSFGTDSTFAGADEYGYVLYFPENGDGTPLNWEDEAGLCGLPTAE